MKIGFFLLLLFWVPIGLFPFQIGGINFYLTNELLYRYNHLSDPRNQWIDSFTLFSKKKNLSMGFTIRGYNFYKRDPNQTFDRAEISFYRKYIQYSTPDLNLYAGDFYSMLGKGLVLSVMENQSVFRERTILGGEVRAHTGNFHLKALAGQVDDELKLNRWFVGGAEAVFSGLKNTNIGAHASYIDDLKGNRGFGRRMTYTASLEGKNLFRWFEYHVEAGATRNERDFDSKGSGLYANLTFRKRPWTVMAEWKRFNRFDNELNNPPVADREDELSTLYDTTGGRFYIQYNFPDPDLMLFVNAGHYQEEGIRGWHFYSGLQVDDIWDRLSANASYGVRDLSYPVKKSFAQVICLLSDTVSFDLSYKRKQYTSQFSSLDEQDLLLQVSRAPSLTAYALYQYSGTPVLDQQNFFSIGIKFSLGKHTTIDLSGGTIRGGEICAGGQCFQEPPFKGIRLSILSVIQ